MQKLIAAAIVVVLGAAPAFAEPGGKGPHGAKNQAESQTDLGAVIISAAERALIREYYQSHNMPADSLPPGIRKKVARGKPLPPGIAKRFPDGLHARLPARPGYDYRVVGADVVLVEIATGLIVDLVKDILR